MNRLSYETLRKHISADAELKDTLATLAGAAAFLASAPGGSAAMLTSALANAGTVGGTARAALDALGRRTAKDYGDRVRIMREAYGAVYLCAYFDELNRQLPEKLRAALALSDGERMGMARQRREDADVPLPDIACSDAAFDDRLRQSYQALTDALREFVNGLAFSDEATERERRAFEDVCERLPSAAAGRFHGYYQDLCACCNEFYIFAWQNEQRQAAQKLEELKRLAENLPRAQRAERVHELTEGLRKTYADAIEKPVIENAGDGLIYPTVDEAYIPHRCQLLRCAEDTRLERRETWKDRPVEPNSSDLLERWLLDPDSTEHLLLILGEPGGGKSMLTQILCGRNRAENAVFLRVPLREHDMAQEIETVVLRQLKKDADAAEDIPGFKWLQREYPHTPVTLVFDGYDEVLQATGGVYRALPDKLHDFQRRRRESGCPVRVVVTSRETLIDKAKVPADTLVMRLLPFDEGQKNDWIANWNDANRGVFADSGIAAFSLPPGNRDLERLSDQPLLLLMLAMYDADLDGGKNALQAETQEGWNRTRLYDSLLRRFIRRECEKGQRGREIRFKEQDEAGQRDAVDAEMRRLGAVALGMLSRNRLYLRTGELEADLAAFEAKPVPYGDPPGVPRLGQAEGVFGRFFFIHRSVSGETDAAYEFLHKTFYEFLLADCALDVLAQAAHRLRTAQMMEASLYRDLLEKAESAAFKPRYYAVLGCGSLCAEPETVRMIAEWTPGKLRGMGLDALAADMGAIVDDILKWHIDLTMRGELTLPPPPPNTPGEDRTVPQRCALYLMNLVAVQAQASGRCRMAAETWARLSQYLRLFLPAAQDEPGGGKWNHVDPAAGRVLPFMAIFSVTEADGAVTVARRDEFLDLKKMSRVRVQETLFDFLQDGMTRTLYTLCDRELNAAEKYASVAALNERGLPMKLQQGIYNLRRVLLHPRLKPLTWKETGLAALSRYEGDASPVLDWLLLLRQALAAGRIVRDSEKDVQALYRRVLRIAKFDPWGGELLAALLDCAAELGGFRGDWEELEELAHRAESATLQGKLYALPPQNARIAQYRADHTLVFFSRDDPTAEEVCAALEQDPPEDVVTAYWAWFEQNYRRLDSKQLGRLLKLFLRSGRFAEVSRFTERRINDLLPAAPGSPALAEALALTRTTQELAECSDYASWNRPAQRFRVREAIFTVLAASQASGATPFISEFLYGYDACFGVSPAACVNALCALDTPGTKVLDYSLANFRYVLDASAQAAARLLILWLKYDDGWYRYVPRAARNAGVSPDDYPAHCLRTLLSRVVADGDHSADAELETLLSLTPDSELYRLGAFLDELTPYLERFFPALAEALRKKRATDGAEQP